MFGEIVATAIVINKENVKLVWLYYENKTLNYSVQSFKVGSIDC